MAHLPLLFFLSVMMMHQEGILEIQPSHQLSECDEFDESKFTEVRVYEGEAAVLRVPLSTSSTVFNNFCANTGFKIEWYKNQSDGHLQQPILWPRISQEGERLWFHPAAFNDTGQYICTVRNGTFCAKIPVWLNVVQRAKEICIAEPAGISTLVKIPLEENRIVTCPDIEDFRHPNRNFSVQWFHNCYLHPNWQGDRGIENDKLVIHLMRENYQGNYTCIVTYKFMGRNISFTRVATVEPVSPSGLSKNPEIQTPDELHVFTVTLGSLAQLACTVFLPYISEEQSEPQVWWEIDGHKVNIHGVSRITTMSKVLTIALGDRTIETTLQIQSFNSQDLKRKYTCNAANSRGNVSRKVVIQYEGHPPHIELGCGLGIPLFLVVVLFGLYHLYWLELLLLYRSCFRSNEVLDGKDYDVYISYARNSEEEQFVLLTLRRVLENELGYRVCIFDRDSLPGGTITDETLSFVSRSRRLIVVLSPHYVLRGTQALLELKAGLDSMAQAGDLRVILVQYQPICRSSWAQELRRARVALTLIQWKGEKSADLSSRFWKQLQMAEFYVVEFPEREEVAVVSKNWMKGEKKCLWPPFVSSDKIRKAVINHAKPDISWQCYTVEIVYSTESYEKARKKAKAIEEDTSFFSDPERQLERGDRCRRPNKRLEELGHGCTSVAVKKRCPSLPRPPPRPVMTSTPEHTSSSSEQSPSPTAAYSETPQPAVTELPMSSVTAVSQNSQRYSTIQPQLITARDRYIVSTLETIKEEMMILKKMVMNLSKTNQMGMTLPEDISLPLTSLEEVNFLEDQLEDRKKMQELTVYLGTIGGEDVASTTRRVMSNLMTNELATQLNWMGHGEKRGFRSLKLCKVVCDAVKRAKPEPGTQDAAVENAAKLWLRNARDRSGGRRQRLIRALERSEQVAKDV